jgi:hypothetical protein
MWLALERGTQAGAIEELLPRLEALERFAEDLRQRFAGAGLEGIGSALELRRRLEDAVAPVPSDELERMRARVRVLESWLADVARTLDRLGRLKAAV